MTLAELYFGASNSGQKEHKIKGVKAIEKYFTVIPIQKALECYGDRKAVLKKQGKLIDDFDLLIGATAVTCNLIMVTENVKHLARIPNINIENWIKK
ncbi:type II toxin-antitoxin system VapC family toxin [Bacteroides faecis]|nr:type II toxin-antitoxin system VapC family toxin [Bacteroides faecis]